MALSRGATYIFARHLRPQLTNIVRTLRVRKMSIPEPPKPEPIPGQLPKMVSVRDLIKLYGLTARAEMSQNFLLDLNVTDKIAKAAGDLKNAAVIEIGPGPGSLTRSLLKCGAPYILAIEKDRRFVPSLQMLGEAVQGRLFVAREDMLELDRNGLISYVHSSSNEIGITPNALHVVGNLPFGIATTLLITWLRDLSAKQGFFNPLSWPVTMTLMFQKEVAMRIAAPPNCKARGRLSVLAQRICDITCPFHVPGSSFVPPPKVDATLVRLTPRVSPIPVENAEILEDVLKELFHMRRKTLRHSLRVRFPKVLERLPALRIDPLARPETLSTEQWCQLADECSKLGWKVKPSHPIKKVNSL